MLSRIAFPEQVINLSKIIPTLNKIFYPPIKTRFYNAFENAAHLSRFDASTWFPNIFYFCALATLALHCLQTIFPATLYHSQHVALQN